MPAIPLWFRVPIEYGVVMAVSAAVAWVYAQFAQASFWLALGIGLSFFVGSDIYLKFFIRRKPKTVHLITTALLTLTALVTMGVLKFV